ncbi:MAG: PfkB family carbohydrate kinase [Acidobacteriota bacterium]
MTNERIEELIGLFPTRRIAVIGDFFLDKYLDVDPGIVEHSVESGKRAHQVVRIRHSPGAAGTVVLNLASLGAATIHTIGIVGDDGEAFDLFTDLHRLGCRTAGLIRSELRMTPTYLKPRDMTDTELSGEHDRYDTKNRDRTPLSLVGQVIGALDAVLPELDGVVISDQVEMDGCGVITSEVRQALAERAKKYPRVVFLADSRAHIHLFRNVIIKPNQFEAVGRPAPKPGDEVAEAELLEAILRLRKENQAPVLVTCGARGMIVSDPEPECVTGVNVPGKIDITGAGDSSSAGAVLALASGATLAEAALIGNLVASITIQQLATTGTATREQVLERFGLWLSQRKEGNHE